MRIAAVAEQLGITPHTIRYYERRGLLPAPSRGANRYREYTELDVERLRLLLGLRRLEVPLELAAELTTLCDAGRCGEVSSELRGLVSAKRAELGRQQAELHQLDLRLAHLGARLDEGDGPRNLVLERKEDGHASTV